MRTEAAKRYQRRFAVVTALYIALVAGNTALTHLTDPTPFAAGAMAILTALPIAAMLALLGIYLREETDEFVRDRTIMSMLIATGVLLSVASIIGMLQFEDLVGTVKVFMAFPLWCAVWGIAQTLLNWRDRRADGVA
ncbi:hypothetical protein DAH66_12130 [Sphingomonas koreensis]|jgi:hypothetical protein|uniref:Uncharacterized protein n=1 Tax=Sphingomonas koreensis TaxID=93064 RepID=A0A430G2V2_9SPHN|nr:hypothetical protein [Sphingomonas koreensis]RSY83876.1 hypothetical protein DAH66_12130 [Sphingomonas koreensis]